MQIFGFSVKMIFMESVNRIMLFAGLLGWLVLLTTSACRTNDSSDGFDVLSFSDDTSAAAELVADANEDLNKIKIMYKKNEAQLEDLKAALGDKDIEKVKKITDDLVFVINGGMGLGEDALGKIEKAEAMNVNADFKEYLNLKAQSLQKQLDAFEHRRQAARLMRDSFGTNDPAAVQKVIAKFKEEEKTAQKTLDVAKEYNKKANDLAKEASKHSH